MDFININWYIALTFCLFFFIGGRQLAEIPDVAPHSRRLFGLILFVFSLPALLFPLAYMLDLVASSAWYNTFRSINRIELFSALVAPAAGYVTYRKPPSPYREFRAPAPVSVIRIIKPLAFPFCLLFISVNFMRPLLLPLDNGATYDDVWTESGVYLQPEVSASGPASLMSAMYKINKFADNEYDALRGTFTDRTGTEFWYLARYASNRGYKTQFIESPGAGDTPVPAIIPVERLSGARGGSVYTRAYVALLGRTDNGALIVGDPSVGRLELSVKDYEALYGEPELALALSAAKIR